MTVWHGACPAQSLTLGTVADGAGLCVHPRPSLGEGGWTTLRVDADVISASLPLVASALALLRANLQTWLVRSTMDEYSTSRVRWRAKMGE